MKKEKIYSVQSWLPFDEILDNGIIKLKDNSYVKIVKINPINFNLKSELEKEAVLNSYKIFLKTCNFDLQILIQSSKEDLSQHIFNIQSQLVLEEKNIQEISKKYIEYIHKLNQNKKSSSKKFYIIIKYINKNKEINNIENYAIEELNEKYYKIKESLARCGNVIKDISDKKEIKEILFSFLNSRIYFNNNLN